MQSCSKVLSWEVRNVQLWRKINPSLPFPTYILWALGYSVNEGVSRHQRDVLIVITLSSEWNRHFKEMLHAGSPSRRTFLRTTVGPFWIFYCWVKNWDSALLSTVYVLFPIPWFLPIFLPRNITEGLDARHQSVWCVFWSLLTFAEHEPYLFYVKYRSAVMFSIVFSPASHRVWNIK